MKNVLEFLETTAEKFGNKLAVKDINEEYTYSEFWLATKKSGSFFCDKIKSREPVVVFSSKSCKTLITFFGIVYAGGFYTLVDPSFPTERINHIFKTLNPKLVITEEQYRGKLSESDYNGVVLDLNEVYAAVDDTKLSAVRANCLDIDPLYGIFTSGSTGNPKCVLVSHRSVIDFINVFTETFDITSEDVIGNQAPFDFDVSVKDIYSAIKTGASLIIIPKEYFMFPNNVIDMLEDNNVTTLIWAVSALCLLNRLHGLKYKVPHAINKIMFSGEMMPVKQLNQWKSFYPNAKYVNLYGPTEITCNCTYYVLDRDFTDEEKLPMGYSFSNEKVFLLDDEENEITEPNVSGEICVSGTCLALGYYNNKEATDKAFCVNPLNKNFKEIMYRTGDLACYDENKMFVFNGRKDFQIKHMGHRIELEEIDIALSAVCGIERACTLFDTEKNKIKAYYVGEIEKGEIVTELKKKLPDFMVPNVFIKIDEMPITKNGKIDRNILKGMK